MFLNKLFISLVVYNLYLVNSELKVYDSGIVPYGQQDVAILFFITITNNGENKVNVELLVVDCCELITSEETDCDAIELYDGNKISLKTKETKNITLIFPNIYKTNRRGSCLFCIRYGDAKSKRHKQFDYRLEFDTKGCDSDVQPCETADLDTFDNCNHVNCLLKYSGYRNYFDYKCKRCQRVPLCVSDTEKDVPDVAYNPVNNKCVNLEQCVTEDDISMISRGLCGAGGKEPEIALNIRCHHGRIDKKTGLCICDHGWRTDEEDPNNHNLCTSTYHMCNVPCHIPSATYFEEYADYVLLMMIAGALLTLFLLLLLCFDYIFQNWNGRQKPEEAPEVVYMPSEDGDEEQKPPPKCFCKKGETPKPRKGCRCFKSKTKVNTTSNSP